MFQTGTLTSQKGPGALDTAEAAEAAEAVAVEAVDMAVCTGAAAEAAVSDAVDMAAEAAEAVVAADAGILAAATREAAEEEGNLPSTFFSIDTFYTQSSYTVI